MMKLILFVNVLLIVFGQFLIKTGMNRIGAFSKENLIPFFMKAALSPFIIFGVLVYVISLALWLIVLSKLELSYAFPIMSLSYVLVVIVSALFLNEPITMFRVVGVGLIVAGVMVMFRS